MGLVSNEVLFDLYKNATFTVFISKYEGYGFPIAESLWHGTPVLISNCGSMIEGQLKINTASDNSIVNYHKANDFANKRIHE